MAEPDAVSRPAIVTVDDDPSVSRAVARDLRRQYGGDHRIVRGESGEQVLEALRELKLRGEQVAVSSTRRAAGKMSMACSRNSMPFICGIR